MAFAKDDIIDKFGAAITELTVATPGTVAGSGAFSVAGDITDWTNSEDAAFAMFVLRYESTSAPAAGQTVDLFAQLKSIQGANDAPVPTANFQHLLLGGFPIKDATSQYVPIAVRLPNLKTSQVYDFFTRNNTNQQMNNTWELWIATKGVGPKPA